MLHNFVIYYRITDWENVYVFNGTFEVSAKCLEDAIEALYEFDELAEYIKHDVDLNPALFEPETDTINQAIESRKNR